MIWKPKSGQRVRIHYRKDAIISMPYHGLIGIVEKCANGKGGPINVLVRVVGIGRAIIPRGNLVDATYKF